MDAVIFDMDGVVTDTAGIHARCWKRVFDDYLRDRSGRRGSSFDPFTNDDYLRYVDGKPRYDGAALFLSSRGAALPQGRPSDPPGDTTVCAIANLKDEEFERAVELDGVVTFPSTIEFVDHLRSRRIACALISSSRHAGRILVVAGIFDLFDAVVGGVEAEALGLPGKPDPAIFLTAARKLGAAPRNAVVVEDALAGVAAGREGGFGLVVGVDRADHAGGLRDHGADVVVGDLAELVLVSGPETER